jgi:hypothetical protein
MQIELYSKLNDPLAAVKQLGEVIARSQFAGCDRVEQGQFLALVCLSENKTPTEILRTFDIVEGKLRKKALAALAEFNAMGGKHKWISTGEGVFADENERFAEIELTLGDAVLRTRFSIADAIRGGAKLKSQKGFDTVWAKNPANMLRARCISNGVAMLAPSIFAGDVEDYTSEVAPREIKMESVPPKIVQAEIISPADAPTVSFPANAQTAAPSPASMQGRAAGESIFTAAPAAEQNTSSTPSTKDGGESPSPAKAGAAEISSEQTAGGGAAQVAQKPKGASAGPPASGISEETESALCDALDFVMPDGSDSMVASRKWMDAHQKSGFIPLTKPLRELPPELAAKILAPATPTQASGADRFAKAVLQWWKDNSAK